MTVGTSAQLTYNMNTKMPEDFPKNSASYIFKIGHFGRTEWRAVFAEFIATTSLVLFGCMACVPMDGYSPQPALVTPIGFSLVVLFNAQIFAHISGAHMNPSVTLAAVICGQKSITVGIVYVIAQCLGALVGYGILVTVAPVDIIADGVCVTIPHESLSEVQSMGVEFALTFVLALVCCALWDPASKHEADSTAIKFGFVIFGLIVVGGPLSGAGLNPVRSLAPAVWTGSWKAHWVYWVGPLLGSAVATVAYKLIWLK